jgi:hypothetical protein
MALLAVEDTPLWEPVAEQVADLKALVDRRQQVLILRDGETKRLRFARTIIRADVGRTVAELTAQVAEL